MKTPKQSTGLKSRPELSSTNNKPHIDFQRRLQNRSLPTDKLLGLLRKESPGFYALAEVVGKWVWITFDDKQSAETTCSLAEFGFHWNRKRQTWQHPCGLYRDRRADFDPRKRYGSYFPAKATAGAKV